MVSDFRPRVREKYEQFGRTCVDRQRFQKHPSFRMDEMKVLEFRAVAFTEGSLNAFANDIEPNAEFPRVRFGECSEEVTVSTPEFQCDLGRRGEKLTAYGAQCLCALFYPNLVLKFPPGNRMKSHDSVHLPVPSLSLAASSDTISTLISAGFTPLIRLAWPSVIGLQAASFCALSFLKPLMDR